MTQVRAPVFNQMDNLSVYRSQVLRFFFCVERVAKTLPARPFAPGLQGGGEKKPPCCVTCSYFISGVIKGKSKKSLKLLAGLKMDEVGSNRGLLSQLV